MTLVIRANHKDPESKPLPDKIVDLLIESTGIDANGDVFGTFEFNTRNYLNSAKSRFDAMERNKAKRSARKQVEN